MDFFSRKQTDTYSDQKKGKMDWKKPRVEVVIHKIVLASSLMSNQFTQHTLKQINFDED
jgi:hypothetical protein